MPMFRLNKLFSVRWFLPGVLTGIMLFSGVLVLERFADCEGFQYDPHGRRDPFVPLVGVAGRAGGAGDLASVMSVDDIALQAILESGDGVRAAIINGEIVWEGQSFGNLAVESVGKNSVKIKIGEDQYEVKLYE